MSEPAAASGDRRRFQQMLTALGRALGEARISLDMTPEEVARIAHVSPLTVRRVESGELGPFTIGSIERIADAVGIPVFFDIVPCADELVVLASSADSPVRVFARRPADEMDADTDVI